MQGLILSLTLRGEHVETVTDVMRIIEKALYDNIKSVPGVASIYESDGIKGITVSKDDLGWSIDINIICFANSNIWTVMKVAQRNLTYVVEKIIKHQDNVRLNIVACDLIEE